MNHARDLGDINPSSPRVKRLLGTMRSLEYRPDALIQVLHVAQGMYGYLPLDVVRFVAKELRVPPARAMGVATFYHFFSLRPKGDHTCLVCTGTACYVKGAQAVIDRIEKDFGIKTGSTTPDNRLSLATARCIGACGMAPAVTFDEEILARVKPEEVTARLRNKLAQVAA
ncbi:MAG: NAD(P)H-dependent oxidoreductase subunit E [Polyangia bacterium]